MTMARPSSAMPASRKGSPYRSGRSPDWVKMKNPEAAAVKREAEEDWG
jgi:ATP-dependent DNA ligase